MHRTSLVAWLRRCFDVPVVARVSERQAPDWHPPFQPISVLLPAVSLPGIKLRRGRVTKPKGIYKCPLIVFHSAWAANLDYYNPHVKLLASWGYAVLQYDLDCGPPLPGDGPCPTFQVVSEEAKALNHVLDWARGCEAMLAIKEHIDWGQIGVAGHSRGGDVAFQQLSPDQAFGKYIVKSAVLLDPVAQHADPREKLNVTDKPVMAVGGTKCSGNAIISRVCSCAPKKVSLDEKFLPCIPPGSGDVLRIPQAGSESDLTIRTWAMSLVAGHFLLQLPPSALASVDLHNAISAYKDWRAWHEEHLDFKTLQCQKENFSAMHPSSVLH